MHFVQLKGALQFQVLRSEKAVAKVPRVLGESLWYGLSPGVSGAVKESRSEWWWINMRWRMLAICSTENRHVVESAIMEWSLEVCWCLTLQEARRGLRRGNHALVLCEAELPDGTYQDVMKLLKHKLDQIRVIVLSESPSEDCYSQAMEMGAFDVISGPCRRTDVQWILLQAIQSHPATTGSSRKGRSRGGPSSFAFA
jgi:CheY-like chemotaxis protein